MPKHIESKLQQHCVRWFRYIYPELSPLLFSVPNGGLRGKTEAAIMKGEGLTEGVSDLLLLVPNRRYHALAIEMKKETFTYEGLKEKRHRSYQRPAQKAWQKAVEAQGYRYQIIYNFDEFEKLITDYLRERDDKH